MVNPEIDDFGTKRWYDENGYLHRENFPAVEKLNGDYFWAVHGKIHRLDGPAVKLGKFKSWHYFGQYLIEIKSQKQFEKWLKLKAFL